jgi:pimeloyl-ACP methyl ester carboxylesterase
MMLLATDKQWIDHLDQEIGSADELGIVPLDQELESIRPISLLRRERKSAFEEPLGIMTLLEREGTLFWEDRPGILPLVGVGRRGLLSRGKVVKQLKYDKLGISQIGAYLERLDKKFTPTTGLKRWQNGQLVECCKPAGDRPVLLFIHGTFSNSDRLFVELLHSEEGRQFLRKKSSSHEILAFDHPTVSVSPVLNAVDLSRLFQGFDKEIDVICHSRGGLVARWWLEALDHPTNVRRRVVLVGSPLAGTSLAAPDKLRNGIDLLTNLARVVGDAASLIPFLTVAMGLLKVVFSVVSVVNKAPVLDAAVAAIPGLAAMSRIQNNFEIKRLNSYQGFRMPEYFAVLSNFEPVSQGWKFWKCFVDYKSRVGNVLLDTLVFDSENDLVVDRDSMLQLAGTVMDLENREQVFNFGTSEVHHTTYFRQPETVQFFERTLL